MILKFIWIHISPLLPALVKNGRSKNRVFVGRHPPKDEKTKWAQKILDSSDFKNKFMI